MGRLITAVAMTMFSIRLPSAATSAMASTKSGNAISTSTNRPTHRSNRPPR